MTQPTHVRLLILDIVLISTLHLGNDEQIGLRLHKRIDTCKVRSTLQYLSFFFLLHTSILREKKMLKARDTK